MRVPPCFRAEMRRVLCPTGQDAGKRSLASPRASPPLELLRRRAAELVEAAAELPADVGVELPDRVAGVEVELGGDADPATDPLDVPRDPGATFQ